MIYAGLFGNKKKHGIKSPCDNNTISEAIKESLRIKPLVSPEETSSICGLNAPGFVPQEHKLLGGAFEEMKKTDATSIFSTGNIISHFL